ncbi:MAG: hypothetical protein ACREXP_32070, partial [Steroidobacteraceae bacterium]
GSTLLAHVLSQRIGRSVIPVGSGWFADLLDLLGDWWDDLGPGGQAVVALGGLGLLGLGLLFPTTLVLAGGIVVTGTKTVPTLVAAGAGVTSIALMAQAASDGTGRTDRSSGEGRASPARSEGGLDASDARSVRSLRKRVAEHRAKLDAYRSSPESFDHQNRLRGVSPTVRNRIIEGRIRHLEAEIRALERQLRMILGE